MGQKHNTRLIFDPTYPEIEFKAFNYDKTWIDFYGNVKEPVPPNASEPCGKPVNLGSFVDSDHAEEKSTRRSRTGYLLYLNNSLITWFSKRQPTVECSVFGGEFVAMKHVMENLGGLRYKL